MIVDQNYFTQVLVLACLKIAVGGKLYCAVFEKLLQKSQCNRKRQCCGAAATSFELYCFREILIWIGIFEHLTE